MQENKLKDKKMRIKWVAMTVFAIFGASAHAGLKTYLDLDDATGLTATGDAAITSGGGGFFGEAATFDGDGDLFTVNTSNAVSGTGARTFAAWVKPDKVTGDQVAVSSGYNTYGAASGQGSKFDMALQNDDLEGAIGAGRSSVDTAVVANEWQFIMISVDTNKTAGDIISYVNGVKTTSDPHTRAVNTFNDTLRIGANAPSAGDPPQHGAYWDGLVDEVSIWDEQLTDDEIVGFYDVGADLGYTADLFEALKNIHDAGSGSVTIGYLQWTYATGLTGAAGLNEAGDTLVLDAVENTGLTAVPTVIIADDFSNGSVTLSARYYEEQIDQGWYAAVGQSGNDSEWEIFGGTMQNAATTDGGWPEAVPAEGVLWQGVANAAVDLQNMEVSFDYDVPAGDELYVYFWGHDGTYDLDNEFIANPQGGNGTFTTGGSDSTDGVAIYNLDDGTTADGTSGTEFVKLTGPVNGTYSVVFSMASLGITGVDSTGDLAYYTIGFAKTENGLAGTTSIDDLVIKPTSSSPTSSGVDLRAYQGIDGVYIEFIAYDVEADGTIQLALIDEEDGVIWSGAVNVSAGPTAVARFLVPGLELGVSYDFQLRDEVGKWWEVDNVVVGSFDVEMTSMSPAGITLSFESHLGVTYEVQWSDVLGGTWQTITNVTATMERTIVVVNPPEEAAGSGFYRIRTH